MPGTSGYSSLVQHPRYRDSVGVCGEDSTYIRIQATLTMELLSLVIYNCNNSHPALSPHQSQSSEPIESKYEQGAGDLMHE